MVRQSHSVHREISHSDCRSRSALQLQHARAAGVLRRCLSARRYRDQRGAVDLAPTLAALLGINQPTQLQRPGVDRSSAQAALRAAPPAPEPASQRTAMRQHRTQAGAGLVGLSRGNSAEESRHRRQRHLRLWSRVRRHRPPSQLGGFVVKGLSREPMTGNPPPRLYETAAGMLNAIGLQNIGARAFLEEKLPLLRQLKDAVVIANVFGYTREDYETYRRDPQRRRGHRRLRIERFLPQHPARRNAIRKRSRVRSMKS